HAKNPDERFQAAKEVADLFGKCLMELQHGQEISVAYRQHYQTRGKVAEALAPYAAKTKPFGGSQRPWRRLALGVLGLPLLLTGTVVYRVATDYGDIVIESDDPDVEVVVKQADAIVTILDNKTKQKVTLRTGEYRLSLGGGADDLTIDLPPTFTLRRGDKKIVSIKRLPPGEITHWKAHNRQAVLALDPAGKILASAGWGGMMRV